MEKKMFEVTTEMTEDEKLNVFVSGYFERINPAIYRGRHRGWLGFSFRFKGSIFGIVPDSV